MMTIAEVNEITGDDVAYWLANPFVDADAMGEKIRWWITVASASAWDRGHATAHGYDLADALDRAEWEQEGGHDPNPYR